MKSLLLIPGPVAVADDVLAAMARPLINHRGPEFAELLARLEERMRPIFGTQSDIVLLGGSGTSGLDGAIACSFSPGQRVLACPIGVFGRRLVNIAKTYGLEVDVLDTELGAGLDPAALAARVRADRDHTYAGILLTQNETSTGAQNEMAPLAAAIGDHPATVIVDAVSGLGASAFAMDAWRFDIVCAASQKALAVPPGLAMVAVSPRGWERMATATAPRFYLDLARARELKASGQTPWTPPVSVCFALDVALDNYVRAGAENVWARHSRYARAVRAAVHALGLELLSRDGAHSDTVVAIRVPDGIDGPAVAKAGRERFGIILGGGQAELKGKIWRIGTMGAISEVDIVGALGIFELVLRENGWNAEPGAATRAALIALGDVERSLAMTAR